MVEALGPSMTTCVIACSGTYRGNSQVHFLLGLSSTAHLSEKVMHVESIHVQAGLSGLWPMIF